MFTLFIFMLLVYLTVYTNTNEIEVINSGIMKLKKNDMVVVFYVTVQHHGNKPWRAMIAMVECCERITEEDTDCDLIDLYGGDFGVIQPGSLKNFTLIYPNIYGYNRKGSCLINILHRYIESSDSSEIHHRIDFDTTVSTDIVPQVLQGWYDPETLIPCETPDLDPFDHCNPVDCHLKYSGYRNYYNRKWKMCQRTPVCLADPNKELPDVAYTPNSNTCRNLEIAITKKDLKLMSSGKLDMKKTEPKMVNIRCHHGEIDPKTGLCVCDRGWKSEAFDEESYNPLTSIYSMCTIKCSWDDNNKFIPSVVGLLLGLWLFFCVLCCEKFQFFCSRQKNTESYSPGEAVYFPLQGYDEFSTVTSMRVSTKTYDGCSRSNTVSHISVPVNYLSEKTLKSSSKSRTSLFSGKNA